MGVKMELYYSSWPEVESYLKSNNKIIIPVGSTEQHGPTGAIGTDFLTAWSIAIEVGQRTNTMVGSPLTVGMALHHMDFPGTVSLKPSTFILYLKEVIASYVKHGFKNITFINGHGGNIAPITSAFSEYLDQDQTVHLALWNWWHHEEVRQYEEKHFADKNGFHATCGEISVTQYCFPQSIPKNADFPYFDTVKKSSWPLSPSQFRKTFPDGRMSSDPRLANAEHGKNLFEIIVQAYTKEILKT